MKLATILSFSLIVSINANVISSKAQGTDLTFKMKDATLKEVMDKIEKSSDFIFVYYDDIFDVNRKVDLDVKKQPIEKILDEMFSSTDNTYTIFDRQIVISLKTQPEIPVDTLSSTEGDFQQISVSGVVKDRSGAALPGVNVVVKGTTLGIFTGSDGSYSIKVPNRNSILQFSFIGYVTTEMTVGAQTSINIVLADEVKTLDEVVVVGYGVQKKVSVVGSISVVKGAEILNSPTTNVTQSLSGRIAGLTTIQTSGKPGFDAATILVRGQSTFGTSSAIYIVDGIERPDFGNIDPNEIESINVLKDASATAVYGIRGANGIIVVTTKRGAAGQAPVISYNANVSMQTLTGMPAILDSYNSATLKNEALMNDGKAVWFTPDELQKFKDHSDPLWYPDVNWYKEMVRKFYPSTQHNISVRGGTNIAKYFISAGYQYSDGMTKDFGEPKGSRSVNNFSKYNFRSNVDLDLTPNLRIGVTLGAALSKAYSPGNSSFGDISFVLGDVIKIPSYAMPVEMPGVGYNDAPTVGLNLLNPIALLTNDGFVQTENNNVETKFDLNYKMDRLVKGLSFRGTFAYDSYSTTTTSSSNGYRLYSITDRRTHSYTVSSQHLTENYGASVSNNVNAGNLNVNFQTGFDYNRSFKNHNITGLLLATRQARQSTGSDAVRAIQGFAGRMTYNYATKYFLEFNAGYNGSENFAKGKRYGFFPSYSGGYTISNENFMKSISWLGLLKIRGSYGLVGNDAIGGTRFLFLNDYTTSGTTQFGDPNSMSNYNLLIHSRIGNPDVTWETGKKSNIGLETQFFKGMISLNIDIFNEVREHILVTNPQSTLTQFGEAFPAINVGKVHNQGYEIEFSIHHKVGQVDFGMQSRLAYNHNSILNIDEPVGKPDYQKQAGKRIGQFFGYMTDGFYKDSTDIANSPVNALAKVIPGDLKFVDYNKDGQINSDDQVPIGYSNRPEYNYSFTPSVTWKGISLEVLFQGVGHVSSNVLLTENTAGQQMYDFMMNRWTPGTASTADWPALHSLGNSFINYNTNDFMLQNAAYLKVRNATLSWRIPELWAKSMGLSALQVTFSGQNLHTWTKYRFGYDPELSSNSAYPTSRVYNFGINAQF